MIESATAWLGSALDWLAVNHPDLVPEVVVCMGGLLLAAIVWAILGFALLGQRGMHR